MRTPAPRNPADPRHAPVRLTVASPPEPPDGVSARIPYLPWLVAAVAWTWAAVALGWVVIGALVSVTWLTAVHTPAAQVVATIGQGWLAAHGVPVDLGGIHLAMPPLGLTALLVAACALAAHHAAGQYELDPDAPASRRWLAWAGVTGAGTGSYLLAGGILAAIVGTPDQLAPALVALLLVALLGAGIGAWVGLGPDPLAGQPDWVRRLPGAAGVGLAVLAAGGLLAFVVAAIAHRGQVAAIHESLAPDGIGTVVLTLVQLFYAPNLVVAAGSFALGAGVSLGGDAFVAPGAVVSGALPAVPVFGAVPVVPGVADFAWLALGPLAGIAAAWWLLRGTGTEVTWLTGLGLGALAPLGAGACWLLLAWASLGDLGTDRLLGLGARFPHLLGWATIPLVVGGALYGVGLALWVGRDSSSPRAQTLQDAPTG